MALDLSGPFDDRPRNIHEAIRRLGLDGSPQQMEQAGLTVYAEMDGAFFALKTAAHRIRPGDSAFLKQQVTGMFTAIRVATSEYVRQPGNARMPETVEECENDLRAWHKFVGPRIVEPFGERVTEANRAHLARCLDKRDFIEGQQVTARGLQGIARLSEEIAHLSHVHPFHMSSEAQQRTARWAVLKWKERGAKLMPTNTGMVPAQQLAHWHWTSLGTVRSAVSTLYGELVSAAKDPNAPELDERPYIAPLFRPWI